MSKVIYDKDLSVISRLVMVCLLLEDKKYIEKIRRGQGKNNIYNIIIGEK